MGNLEVQREIFNRIIKTQPPLAWSFNQRADQNADPQNKTSYTNMINELFEANELDRVRGGNGIRLAKLFVRSNCFS